MSGAARVTVPAAPASRAWQQESVRICTPHTVSTGANYTYSVGCVMAWDTGHHGLLVRGGGPMMFPAGPMNLPDVRNRMCRQAIDDGVDWVLFVDADAGFDADAVDRLVEAADPDQRPVVGALSFQVERQDPDGMGGWDWVAKPTLYQWGGPNGKPGFFFRLDYPDNTLVQVAATGCHMLLISTQTLSKLAAEHGDTWFTRTSYDPKHGVMGEDFSFCFLLGVHHIPLYVHTGVKTNHLVTVTIDERHFQRAAVISDLTDQARAAAADQPPAGVVIDGG